MDLKFNIWCFKCRGINKVRVYNFNIVIFVVVNLRVEFCIRIIWSIYIVIENILCIDFSDCIFNFNVIEINCDREVF